MKKLVNNIKFSFWGSLSASILYTVFSLIYIFFIKAIWIKECLLPVLISVFVSFFATLMNQINTYNYKKQELLETLKVETKAFVYSLSEEFKVFLRLQIEYENFLSFINKEKVSASENSQILLYRQSLFEEIEKIRSLHFLYCSKFYTPCFDELKFVYRYQSKSRHFKDLFAISYFNQLFERIDHYNLKFCRNDYCVELNDNLKSDNLLFNPLYITFNKYEHSKLYFLCENFSANLSSVVANLDKGTSTFDPNYESDCIISESGVMQSKPFDNNNDCDLKTIIKDAIIDADKQINTPATFNDNSQPISSKSIKKLLVLIFKPNKIQVNSETPILFLSLILTLVFKCLSIICLFLFLSLLFLLIHKLICLLLPNFLGLEPISTFNCLIGIPQGFLLIVLRRIFDMVSNTFEKYKYPAAYILGYGAIAIACVGLLLE